MAKYEIGDDHEWADEQAPEHEGNSSRVSIERHELDVIIVTDPDEDMGYGREKWTAHLTHGNPDDPTVLYFTEHRWKGNYWRDVRECDYLDAPIEAKRKVARWIQDASVESLNPGVRVVDEGGETPAHWRVRGGGGDE